MSDWIPMEDGVLIHRLEPIEQARKSKIILTDMATADNEMLLRKGRILACGPGKWIEGTWWHFKTGWEWIPGYRESLDVKPGQEVIFNARWNDLSHAEHGRPLSYRYDKEIHLVQEADIAGILA